MSRKYQYMNVQRAHETLYQILSSLDFRPWEIVPEVNTIFRIGVTFYDPESPDLNVDRIIVLQKARKIARRYRCKELVLGPVYDGDQVLVMYLGFKPI